MQIGGASIIRKYLGVSISGVAVPNPFSSKDQLQSLALHLNSTLSTSAANLFMRDVALTAAREQIALTAIQSSVLPVLFSGRDMQVCLPPALPATRKLHKRKKRKPDEEESDDDASDVQNHVNFLDRIAEPSWEIVKLLAFQALFHSLCEGQKAIFLTENDKITQCLTTALTSHLDSEFVPMEIGVLTEGSLGEAKLKGRAFWNPNWAIIISSLSSLERCLRASSGDDACCLSRVTFACVWDWQGAVAKGNSSRSRNNQKIGLDVLNTLLHFDRQLCLISVCGDAIEDETYKSLRKSKPITAIVNIGCLQSLRHVSKVDLRFSLTKSISGKLEWIKKNLRKFLPYGSVVVYFASLSELVRTATVIESLTAEDGTQIQSIVLNEYLVNDGDQTDLTEVTNALKLGHSPSSQPVVILLTHENSWRLASLKFPTVILYEMPSATNAKALRDPILPAERFIISCCSAGLSLTTPNALCLGSSIPQETLSPEGASSSARCYGIIMEDRDEEVCAHLDAVFQSYGWPESTKIIKTLALRDQNYCRSQLESTPFLISSPHRDFGNLQLGSKLSSKPASIPIAPPPPPPPCPQSHVARKKGSKRQHQHHPGLGTSESPQNILTVGAQRTSKGTTTIIRPEDDLPSSEDESDDGKETSNMKTSSSSLLDPRKLAARKVANLALFRATQTQN